MFDELMLLMILIVKKLLEHPRKRATENKSRTIQKRKSNKNKTINHIEIFGENVRIELKLSSYATKLDLKNAAGVDASKLTSKSDLPSLPEIDKVDVGKLKTASADLSKLSNIVNNDVEKKAIFDALVAKVNNIDVNGFVLKTKYNTDKSEKKFRK